MDMLSSAEKLAEIKAILAGAIVETGVFLDRTNSPEGQGFRLKLHDTQPEAPLSPFYINLRRLCGSGNALGIAADALAVLIEASGLEFEFDRLAGIPLASLPFVGVLAVNLDKPMVIPRPPKTHGTGETVEGPFEEGETILLVDDLVTKADSKLEAADVLRKKGLTVKDCIVLVDREQGGAAQLAEAGITLHSVFTISELLDILEKEEHLDPETAAEIREYLAAN